MQNHHDLELDSEQTEPRRGKRAIAQARRQRELTFEAHARALRARMLMLERVCVAFGLVLAGVVLLTAHLWLRLR